MVPVGLAYLSAYLKERMGDRVETRIVSTLVDLEKPEDIKDVLRQFSPHVVGIRWVVFYTAVVEHLLELSRQIAPRALRVLGGPQVTGEPDSVLPETADVFVRGEGEGAFGEIVERLLQYGRDDLFSHLPSVKGIAFRAAGRLIRNVDREPLAELDQLPIPDYTIIDMAKYKDYLNFGYNRRPMGALFTSRGCPYHCIYCHRIFGKRFRARSAATVYDEISYLNRHYQINDFSIVDDNFNFDKARVEELSKLLVTKGPRVNLYFPNGLRGDLLSFDLFDRLVDAGMIYVSFSLETASPRLQKLIKKNINIGKLKEMVDYSCEKGVITNLAMMVGFPSETVEEARYSLEYFAQFKKVALPYYFSVKYYPGTELYRLAEQFGVSIDPEVYDSPYHGYQFQESPTISKKDFEELNRWYLRNIFLDSHRIRNAVKILSRHFTSEEINEIFSLFLRRPIKNIEADVISKY